MPPISAQLLQSFSEEFCRLPADPDDLVTAASEFGVWLDGLARLDELNLLAVEPATVLLPPSEDSRGTR